MWRRIYLAVENLITVRLVPVQGPGRISRWLFKMPIILYRLGMSSLVPKGILILTTVGRRTGRRRETAVEYGYDPDTNTYRVMSGWSGRTDWYRNARANPSVCVQIGRRKFEAVAEPMSDDDVAQILIQVTRINPGSLRIWSRWANLPLDGSPASLRQAAPYFPSLVLRPK